MAEPQLPAAYELVIRESADNLRSEALGQVYAGADEGTLIWCHSTSATTGAFEKPWLSHQGDLLCSIVLRPEFDVDRYGELLIVGAIALGNALGQHLSPMTALQFSWPNDITIARQKVASLWLDAATADSAEPWLVVSCAVNILHSPEDVSMEAMSIAEAEGSTDLDAPRLLESYAREFVTQINAWAEQGFSGILRKWRSRLDTSVPVSILSSGKILQAQIQSIGDDGSAIVGENGIAQRLEFSQYVEMHEVPKSVQHPGSDAE